MASNSRPASTGKSLKSLVKQEIDRVSNAALEHGALTDEDLAKLSQLADLDARLPKPPAHPARRWPVILLLLGIFLVPGLMISLKVPKVDIQASLTVSELSWRQQAAGSIMGSVQLDSLNVASFNIVSLPRTRTAEAEALTQPPVNFTLPETDGGRISLSSAHAEAGTRVWISTAPEQGTAELSMLGDAAKITANLAGNIHISSVSGSGEQRDFGRPRPVDIQASQPNLLHLTMRLKEASGLTFPSHILISGISFQRVENAGKSGLRTPRQASNVLAGTIFNESMNGKQYGLRKGEWLLLDGVDGEIRSMEITEAGISLDYHGQVTDIRVGSSGNQRSLMPNYLEWFGARHSVKMLWGAFIWLSTTLFGVIKWWKRPH